MSLSYAENESNGDIYERSIDFNNGEQMIIHDEDGLIVSLWHDETTSLINITQNDRNAFIEYLKKCVEMLERKK